MTKAHISLQKKVQGRFSEAVELLWVMEIRRFCQNAITDDDFTERFVPSGALI